jgi:hypothetical protein
VVAVITLDDVFDSISYLHKAHGYLGLLLFSPFLAKLFCGGIQRAVISKKYFFAFVTKLADN